MNKNLDNDKNNSIKIENKNEELIKSHSIKNDLNDNSVKEINDKIIYDQNKNNNKNKNLKNDYKILD